MIEAATDNVLVGQSSIVLPLPEIRILLLFLGILLSALFLIYVKDLNRRLFIESEDLQQVSQQLVVEHDRLVLEDSTWASTARIQQIAETELNMKLPTQNDVVLVSQ